ncbi:MAG: Type I transmembrane sorting receptor [Piccolia ochrophora]|nr:MAG: Type I transmembrane sorting receptor [Piccolia ochrophora]
MQILQILWSLAALALVVDANPIEKRKTFTVNQIVKQKSKPKNGPKAYAAALAKHNGTIPANLAAAAKNDGTVSATPTDFDTQYLCPVNIGGQILDLNFDTGSSDLWVFSNLLSTASQRGHSVYSPARSSTFRTLAGYTWQIRYGDGSSASGDVGLDTVTIGTTQVKNQAVELASTVSPSFINQESDGLLGLGFSSINTVRPQQQLTFFDNARPTLSSPLFTADLRPASPGAYDFGFIDTSRYTGNIAYTPVNSANGFWEFTSPGYAIGNGPLRPTPVDAIADTGTTLLLLTDPIVTAYYAAVPSARFDEAEGGYTFPCSTPLPAFTFAVTPTYRAVVPGSLINFAPVDAAGRTCFGGIQSVGDIGFSIFGDIVFKSQFVVFDGGNQRLGFARKP